MKIFDWIRNILFVIAIVVVIGAIACFAMKWKPAVVMSGSMEPTFHTGSVVFVDKDASYKVGDPVAFYNGNAYVTHRLIDTTELKDGTVGYITKGDANADQDTAIITDENIEGKVVFCIPVLGYIFHYAQQKFVIIIAAALIICLFLASFLTSKKPEEEKGDTTVLENEALKAEVEKSRNENISLQAKHESLKLENESLKAELAKLDTQSLEKAAAEKIKAAKAEAVKLGERYDRLYKRHMDIIDYLVRTNKLKAEDAEKERKYFTR